MNKSLLSFLAGVVLGYQGVRSLTHIAYLTIIIGLTIGLVLK